MPASRNALIRLRSKAAISNALECYTYKDQRFMHPYLLTLYFNCQEILTITVGASVPHTDRPILCAIKQQAQACGWLGGGKGMGKSKFTSAVKRQRRSVFNIFQRVLPFHVVSSSSSASAPGTGAGAVPVPVGVTVAEKRTEDTDTLGVEWSILFLRLLCRHSWDGNGNGRDTNLYAQLQTKKS